METTIAIVTGAGRGIGRAVAVGLGRRGHHVVVADIDEQGAGETVRLVTNGGATASTVTCDVTDAAAVRAAVETVVARHGRIDVLVNNAGIIRPAMLDDMSLSDWDAVLATNLTGAFLMIQAVVTASMRERGGAIVNVSSVAGLRGTVGQVNYAAAKAGVVGLTKACALELGRHGIRVNAVSPGTVETDMTHQIMSRRKLRERYLREIVLGRFGQPDDVARAVAFLASEEAAWITGKVLGVDGGAYM